MRIVSHWQSCVLNIQTSHLSTKISGVPTWSAWLDDWRYSSASDIKVQNMQPGQTTLGLPEDDSLEQAPVIRGIVTRDTVPEMN